MKRLGIVVSHPIQYYSPLFRHLAQSIDLIVFFCHRPTEDEIGREGFGKKFSWSLDLMSGYKSVFLQNVSKNPSLVNFFGCDTPEIGTALVENKITHLVILGWYLKSYIQALRSARKLKIKVAVRGDSQLNPEEPFFRHLIKKIIYPFLLSKYDKILYVGNRNKEYLLHFGAKEIQLIFSPHAVDQDFWHNDIPKERGNNTIYIWIGKFIPKKRPQDVIIAFIEAYKQHSAISLWMAGSGELSDSCIKLASGHPAIVFYGFKNQTELRSLASKADALILSSDYGETWGLVVNECFAMGLPAIVSEGCGASEDLILSGETGYTYPVGECKELQNKILLLAEQKRGGKSFKKEINRKNELYSYNRNTAAFMQFINC